MGIAVSADDWSKGNVNAHSSSEEDSQSGDGESGLHFGAGILHQSAGTVGAKVPQCEDDGVYSAMQTWGSIGMSRCVRVDGTPIPSYDYSRTIRSCKCPRVRDAALNSGLMGAFAPACNPTTGQYLPRQTQEGYSFCVDAEGTQIGQAVHMTSAIALSC